MHTVSTSAVFQSHPITVQVLNGYGSPAQLGVGRSAELGGGGATSTTTGSYPSTFASSSSNALSSSDAGPGLQPSPPPSPPPPLPTVLLPSLAGGGGDCNTGAAGSEGISGRGQRLPVFEQGRVLAPPEPLESRREPSRLRPRNHLRGLSKTAARLGKPLPRKLTGATARGEEQQRPASRQTKAEEAEAAWLKASFRPFPSLLRWPTAPCFACICCMSGLLQGATTILVAHKTAPRHAVAAAAVGAAVVLGVLLLLWTQLVVFARHHAHHMWVPQKAPITPSGVEDPALRLVSTLRQRALRHSSQQQVSSGVKRRSIVLIEQSPTLARTKGCFATHGHREHESAEPERTERLLANPLALFPPTASDAYESVAVTVLYKCRGDRKHAMAYHLGRLNVQVPYDTSTLYTCTKGL